MANKSIHKRLITARQQLIKYAFLINVLISNTVPFKHKDDMYIFACTNAYFHITTYHKHIIYPSAPLQQEKKKVHMCFIQKTIVGLILFPLSMMMMYGQPSQVIHFLTHTHTHRHACMYARTHTGEKLQSAYSSYVSVSKPIYIVWLDTGVHGVHGVHG